MTVMFVYVYESRPLTSTSIYEYVCNTVTEKKLIIFFCVCECISRWMRALHATHTLTNFSVKRLVIRFFLAFFRARFHLRRLSRFHSWMEEQCNIQQDYTKRSRLVSDWVACVEAIIIIIVTVISFWSFVSDLSFSVWFLMDLEHCF